jgi:hypothetical protein
MSFEEPLLSPEDKEQLFGVSRNVLVKLFEKENRTNDSGGISESRK